MLAGIAAGFFRDEKDAVNRCSVKTGETLPDPENNKKYAEIFKRYKKIQVLLKDVYDG